VVSVTPRPFYPDKEFRHPLNLEKSKNLLFLPESEPRTKVADFKKLYLKYWIDIVRFWCRNVKNTADIVTLFLKRLQNGFRTDCWSQMCDMILFNAELLLTGKFKRMNADCQFA
jgi:hypothetical protein